MVLLGRWALAFINMAMKINEKNDVKNMLLMVYTRVDSREAENPPLVTNMAKKVMTKWWLSVSVGMTGQRRGLSTSPPSSPQAPSPLKWSNTQCAPNRMKKKHHLSFL